MNTVSVACVSLVAVLALFARPGSAQINCYVCQGGSASGDPCGNSLNTQSTSVTVASGCQSCTKIWATTQGQTIYGRECNPQTVSQTNTGCCKMSQTNTCAYACSGNLCNSATQHGLTVGTVYGRLLIAGVALAGALLAKVVY